MNSGEELRDILSARPLPIIGSSTAVFKDECILSCDSPASPKGLYVNLENLTCCGQRFLLPDHTRTGCRLYLRIQERRKYKKQEEIEGVNKMGIGVEGGFDAGGGYDVETQYSIVVMPGLTAKPLPRAAADIATAEWIPEALRQTVVRVINSDSSGSATKFVPWEEAPPQVSKHAEGLQQTPNPPAIPPANWQCAECGNKENLWLNLSTGFIGCGRKQFDGRGGCADGREGAAVGHYEQNVSAPLAVKLGSITADAADVYSYEEGDMVKDPNLERHLAHFGIDCKKLVKSEKSFNELALEVNRAAEWRSILETDTELQRAEGPGLIGLSNTGNSCYVSTVLQCLATLPSVAAVLADQSRFDALVRDIEVGGEGGRECA
eukprot:GHVU01104097.1.p2 GENE.GHVU01104097.1~~GHVU01104097.1.p2  ORF type:complete len:378 (+),score=87.17 GHVU01104097.1:125-1258(+)